MRILVTGAGGFLGGQTAEDLRRRGHDVLTTDRRGSVMFSGDLADTTFTAALPDVDAIVHAAGVHTVSPDLPFWRRQTWFDRNNVAATRNLVDRYRRSNAHFVYISTSMTYAQNGGPCGSLTPRQAQGPYSASKLQAESYVTAHAAASAAIVPCIIAGNGRGGLFVPFVRSMRRLGVAIVPGLGRNKVSLVHVEDVSSLIALVVERRARGVFNAAGQEPASLLDWVAEIEQTLGLQSVRRLTIPYGLLHRLTASVGYRLLAQEQVLMLNHDHVLSVEASTALGWAPRWSNKEIIRDTAQSLARKS